MKKSDSHLMDWPAVRQTAQQAAIATELPTYLAQLPEGVECIFKEETQWIYLARIRVPVGLRQKGIGSTLVMLLKQHVRNKRFRGIRLSFQPDEGCEDQVRHFYKKHGFHFLSCNEIMVWTK